MTDALDQKGLEAAATALSGAPFPCKRSLAKAEAAIRAYLSALPSPSGLEVVAMPGIYPTKDIPAGVWVCREHDVRAVVSAAQSLLSSQAQEIARCHARLEIDRVYVGKDDDTFEEQAVPMDERLSIPDGIEARDETIKGLEQQIERLIRERDDHNAAATDANNALIAAEQQVQRLSEALDSIVCEVAGTEQFYECQSIARQALNQEAEG